MPTIQEIAAKAFGKIDEKLPGVLLDCSLLESVNNGFDHATATNIVDLTLRGTVKAMVVTDKPITSVFPGYVAGHGEELVLLWGTDVEPRPDWTMRFPGDVDRRVVKVQDILHAGAIYYVVVR